MSENAGTLPAAMVTCVRLEKLPSQRVQKLDKCAFDMAGVRRNRNLGLCCGTQSLDFLLLSWRHGSVSVAGPHRGPAARQVIQSN